MSAPSLPIQGVAPEEILARARHVAENSTNAGLVNVAKQLLAFHNLLGDGYLFGLTADLFLLMCEEQALEETGID